MQKLKCQIQNDTSVLDYKNQAFNYFKCILQYETSGDQPVQPPLLKQGHQERAAQDHIQIALEYFPRRRLHNLS